jgi:hypothetical protein
MKIRNVNVAPFVILAVNFSLWFFVISAGYGGVKLYRHYFGSSYLASSILSPDKGSTLLQNGSYEFVSGNSQALIVRVAVGPVVYRPQPDSLLIKGAEDRYYWRSDEIFPSRFYLRKAFIAMPTQFDWGTDFSLAMASVLKLGKKDFGGCS